MKNSYWILGGLYIVFIYLSVKTVMNMAKHSFLKNSGPWFGLMIASALLNLFYFFYLVLSKSI